MLRTYFEAHGDDWCASHSAGNQWGCDDDATTVAAMCVYDHFLGYLVAIFAPALYCVSVETQ